MIYIGAADFLPDFVEASQKSGIAEVHRAPVYYEETECLAQAGQGKINLICWWMENRLLPTVWIKVDSLTILEWNANRQ